MGDSPASATIHSISHDLSTVFEETANFKTKLMSGKDILQTITWSATTTTTIVENGTEGSKDVGGYSIILSKTLSKPEFSDK